MYVSTDVYVLCVGGGRYWYAYVHVCVLVYVYINWCVYMGVSICRVYVYVCEGLCYAQVGVEYLCVQGCMDAEVYVYQLVCVCCVQWMWVLACMCACVWVLVCVCVICWYISSVCVWGVYVYVCIYID